MNKPIAVLAGTPVDTQMGIAFLKQAGRTGVAFPISSDPVTQTQFQISSPSEKHAFVGGLLDRAKAQNCDSAFVYCNSLSSSVNFPALAKEKRLRIVTPLDVYREAAGRYTRLGVIAANAQGLAGIERTLMQANPKLHLYGACCLDAVLAVEDKEPPEEIVERLHLTALVGWFTVCGCQALVLGCTHFPYFKLALKKKTSLSLIDPADRMVELLAQ